MGIFDNLMNKAAGGIQGAVSNMGKETGPKTITFERLPESVEEMKALPQAQHLLGQPGGGEGPLLCQLLQAQAVPVAAQKQRPFFLRQCATGI